MDYANIAKKAAKEAGEMLLNYRGKDKHIHFKAERDIATKADKDSEELLRKMLIEDSFPEHDFVSEESPFDPEEGKEFVWIVDPIDGTGNFAHENPIFCVSVGLLKDKKPYAGAIYAPVLGELYSAQKGKGALLNGRKISVSQHSEFYDLLLSVEMAPKENVIRRTLLMEKELALKHRVRTLGSAAIDLAYVACGRFDAFISAYLYTWDVSAGMSILEEAGGIGTQTSGERLDLTQKSFGFAASNGKLHKQLIEKLRI